MNIRDEVILITGANRGLGLAFAKEALARGARKVYAAARQPASITLPGVVPLQLDVTKPDQIAAAAQQCQDVTIVVNNAGIALTGGVLDADSETSARDHLDVNFFGVWRVSQAFAPILKANGGGALLNVLSVVSWANSPALGVYGVSKSAAWGLTNNLRSELRQQNTQVLALHMGFVDTDLVRGFNAPKTAPEVIASRAYDALAAGLDEVMADDIAQHVKQSLSGTQAVYLRNFND